MYVPKWMRTKIPKGWLMAIAATAGVSGGCYNFFHGKPNDDYKFDQDLAGKTYIVVGATSGIGKETTKELAKRKAKVIMACRNNRKCIEARRSLVIATKNMEIYCRRLNLEDFDSIRDFVLKLDTGKGNIERIDGIVYSAATAESDRKTNMQHIERTFATNHLGPFLLTSLLYDRLLKQSSAVRLVFLNTSDLKLNELNFDNLNSADLMKWQKTPEQAKKDAYYQSKLALALFVKSLSEKVNGTNLRVTMVDPGLTRTDLFYRLEGAEKRFFFVRWCKSLKRWIYGLVAAQSATDATKPVLYALADEKMEDANGVFIDSIRSQLPWHQLASEPSVVDKLWLTSAKWTGTADHLKRLQQDLRKPKPVEGGLMQNVKKPTTGWLSWFL